MFSYCVESIGAAFASHRVLLEMEIVLSSNQFEQKLLGTMMRRRSCGMHVRVDTETRSENRLATQKKQTLLSRSDFDCLPVIYIMAHSSYDVMFEETMVDEHSVAIGTRGSRTFTVPDSCVTVSATPVGAMGLVFEDCNSEVDNSIVNMTGIGFKQWLMGGENNLPRASLLTDRLPRGYKPVSSFCAEGTETIDKEFEFFGDTLAGGGFGVLKLGNEESLASVIASEGLSKDFLYNGMRRIPKLYRVVREAARTEKSVPLRKIMSLLGPGIYISCACSNVQAYIRRVRSKSVTRLPFAAGRSLAVRLYKDAYDEVLSKVKCGNIEWRSWIKNISGRAIHENEDRPVVDCTFVASDPNEYSPTSSAGMPLTRAATKALRRSQEKYPSIE